MPFFVSFCDQDSNQLYYEWDVDPLTRQPFIPEEDKQEIRERLEECDELVFQNAKFDAKVLSLILKGIQWHWHKVRDTLFAGHLLASNKPHDLTSMALMWLGVDISRYEKALEVAVKEARSLCRRFLPDWRIAKSGESDMPSAKETVWRYDYWLPRAICQYAQMKLEMWKEHLEEYPNHEERDTGPTEWWYEYASQDHPWLTVLSDYANTDPAVTLPLHQKQLQLIQERGLEAIYNERLKLIPIVYEMELRGVTLSKTRLEEQLQEFKEEAQRSGKICTNIAKQLGHELSLPKTGNNKSLIEFVFGYTLVECRECETSEHTHGPVAINAHCPECKNPLTITRVKNLGLPPQKFSKKTGAPSLDKMALEYYQQHLEPNTTSHTFVRHLRGKRRRDTAVGYMEGYQRYWLPWIPAWEGAVDPVTGAGWYVLHPSFNPTGSDTLRWSSQWPNAQNISKQEDFSLRTVFGPAPGREWWSCDAKNIELRLPFYESGEQELIDLFERPNDPPYYGSNHLLNFHTVYEDIWNKELAEVGFDKVGPHCKKKYASTWYQWCKNGAFSKQYGAGKEKTDSTFRRPGAYDLLDSRFSQLAKLNTWCIKHAERTGYVETIIDRSLGTGRGYPLFCTRTEYGKILSTVPLSYRIQGSAMWWMCKAMIRCEERLLEWKRQQVVDAWMTIQVHDEIVFDFPKSEIVSGVPSNYPYVRQLMDQMERGGDDYGIPTPVGCEYHPNHWGESETIEVVA